MRAHLLDLDYEFYGLSESDFDYIVAVVKGAHDYRIELTQQAIEPLRSDPDAAEIVDDKPIMRTLKRRSCGSTQYGDSRASSKA
jgi:hypothetical protein